MAAETEMIDCASKIDPEPGLVSRRFWVTIGCLAASTLLLGYLSAVSTGVAAQTPPSD